MGDYEYKIEDESGLSLTDIIRYEEKDGVIFHVRFTFRLLDTNTEAYDLIDLKLQLRDTDLDNLTINEVKKRALARAVTIVKSLSSHIEEQA